MAAGGREGGEGKGRKPKEQEQWCGSSAPCMGVASSWLRGRHCSLTPPVALVWPLSAQRGVWFSLPQRPLRRRGSLCAEAQRMKVILKSGKGCWTGAWIGGWWCSERRKGFRKSFSRSRKLLSLAWFPSGSHPKASEEGGHQRVFGWPQHSGSRGTLCLLF